jgi:hypothetical protein
MVRSLSQWIERIRDIKQQTQVFMTLHGASGTDDGDLRRAIAARITVIHILQRPLHAAKRNRSLRNSSEGHRHGKATRGCQIGIVQQWGLPEKRIVASPMMSLRGRCKKI